MPSREQEFKKIEEFSIRDLARVPEPHKNLFNKTLFKKRGILVAFQKASNAEIGVHSHPHSELIYLAEGTYGLHNAETIGASGKSFYEIKKETEHGGKTTNGIWLSVKPENHELVETEGVAGIHSFTFKHEDGSLAHIIHGDAYDHIKHANIFAHADAFLSFSRNGVTVFNPKKWHDIPVQALGKKFVALHFSGS